MELQKKAKIAKNIALPVAILPTVVATITQFPIWIERSAEATSSGVKLSAGVIICSLLSMMPALKKARGFFKSYAALFFSIFLFAGIATFRPIINELYAVSLTFMVSQMASFGIQKTGIVLDNKAIKKGLKTKEINKNDAGN